MQRLPRLVELLLVVALVGLIAFWGTRMLRGDPLAVPPAVSPTFEDGASGRVQAALGSARLFGSRPPGALSDNVRALGVVADAGGNGSVIVSVDGQAPRVYRVGDTLDGRTVVAIRADQIELDARGARQVFRLPTSAQATVPGVARFNPRSSSGPLPVAAPPSFNGPGPYDQPLPGGQPPVPMPSIAEPPSDQDAPGPPPGNTQ